MTTPFTYLRGAAFAVAALLCAELGAFAPANAQETETADSTAVVVNPLSFVKQYDLDFGLIIPSTTDGVVVMDTDGVVTTNNGIVHIDGSQQPAVFWGYGEVNQTVLIDLDARNYTLVRDGGTETMLLDRLRFDTIPRSANARRFRVTRPDGFFSFALAGRLRVGANQVPGVYTAPMIVTLEYE